MKNVLNLKVMKVSKLFVLTSFEPSSKIKKNYACLLTPKTNLHNESQQLFMFIKLITLILNYCILVQLLSSFKYQIKKKFYMLNYSRAFMFFKKYIYFFNFKLYMAIKTSSSKKIWINFRFFFFLIFLSCFTSYQNFWRNNTQNNCEEFHFKFIKLMCKYYSQNNNVKTKYFYCLFRLCSASKIFSL